MLGERRDADTCFLDWFEHRVGRVVDQPALVAEHRTLTYGDLMAALRRVRQFCDTEGLKPGDRVALIGQNSLDYAVWFLGLIRMSLVAVPLNPRGTLREWTQLCNQANVRAVMVDAAKDSPEFRSVFGGEIPIYRLESAEVTVAHADVALPDRPSAITPALMIFTSGTTGAPKAVEYSHQILSDFLEQQSVSGLGGWTDGDRALCFLPFHHIAGIKVFFSVLNVLGCAIFVTDIRSDRLVDAIEQHCVSRISLVPTLLESLVTAGNDVGDRLKSLRGITYGASQITPELLSQVRSVLSCDLYQVYGATETTGGATMLSPDQHKADPALLASCGRALPGMELEIRHPGSQTALPALQVGEVCVQGPTVVLGYVDDPEANAKAFTADGWFRTGDAGYLDEDGNLFITDRIKDIIISGGENIVPREVERALLSQETVLEAAVFGIPHHHWGEAVVAAVVTEPAAGQCEEDLIARCAHNLAKFKIPKRILFLDELPRNSAGKVLKRDLQTRFGSVFQQISVQEGNDHG